MAMLKQTSAVIALLCFAVPAASAGPADDVTGAIGQCAVLKDNAARLGCYDTLAARLKPLVAAPQASVAPPPQTAVAAPLPPQLPQQTIVVAPPPPAPPVAAKEDGSSWFGITEWFGATSPKAQTTPQQFGSESLPVPPSKPGETAQPQPLDSITAMTTDVAVNHFGRFTVFLDNGQVWQQLAGDIDKAHFPHDDKTKVTISRGALGSYNLQIEDKARVYKVKRIK